MHTTAATGEAAAHGRVAGTAAGRAASATGPAPAVRSGATPSKGFIRLNLLASTTVHRWLMHGKPDGAQMPAICTPLQVMLLCLHAA